MVCGGIWDHIGGTIIFRYQELSDSGRYWKNPVTVQHELKLSLQSTSFGNGLSVYLGGVFLNLVHVFVTLAQDILMWQSYLVDVRLNL